jgi:Tol biopolymer transport system component
MSLKPARAHAFCDSFFAGLSWSTGDVLAYPSDCEVFTVRADGTGSRRLTNGVEDYNPAWSPDGTKIAVARYPCTRRLHAQDRCFSGLSSSIVVMNADGTDAHTLISGTRKNF